MTGGAVAIWHDIVAEGLDEFYAWHGEEHMPERTGIPGFRCGRRFVALDSSVGFFNLYETASPDVVKGPDYKARLDNPTPRTLSAVRHFRNVARSLCRVGLRIGTAQGGTVATLRYEVAPEREAGHAAQLAPLLASLAAQPGVASVQWLVADKAASGYVNAEQRARGAANAVPPFAVVCEGWSDIGVLRKAVATVLSARVCAELGCQDPILDWFAHQLTVSGTAS